MPEIFVILDTPLACTEREHSTEITAAENVYSIPLKRSTLVHDDHLDGFLAGRDSDRACSLEFVAQSDTVA